MLSGQASYAVSTGFPVALSLVEIANPTTRLTSRTDVLVSVNSAGRILVGSCLDFSAKLRRVSEGEAMSDRRRFLKGLTSIPLATVLANPRLAAAVTAG